MHHISGLDRNQLQVISLDHMVEKEAMVRIIDTLVNILDMKQFGFLITSLIKKVSLLFIL